MVRVLTSYIYVQFMQASQIHGHHGVRGRVALFVAQELPLGHAHVDKGPVELVQDMLQQLKVAPMVSTAHRTLRELQNSVH